MCRDTEQLLHFLVSHDVVLGEFRCERCGLNLVSVVLSVCGFFQGPACNQLYISRQQIAQKHT